MHIRTAEASSSHPWSVADDLPLFPTPNFSGHAVCQLQLDGRGVPTLGSTSSASASPSASSVLRAPMPQEGKRARRKDEAAAEAMAVVRVGALLLAALALVWGGVLRSWREGSQQESRQRDGGMVEMEGGAMLLLEENDEEKEEERGPLLGPMLGARACRYGSTVAAPLNGGPK